MRVWGPPIWELIDVFVASISGFHPASLMPPGAGAAARRDPTELGRKVCVVNIFVSAAPVK